ncbi:FAD-dependent monooxygenase [Streptomyces sp. TS71-3]|uniref:FAD-dependent monooxygenase n=1 Tax=Streptomyces sp. TS71-3 TaxID=2733862 RepID=UPI001AFF1F1B|nr:FAD-dependent monooxygenase [Streptomyces sp. TS71-3]GHJ41898.1 oxidoreductase [Streptomyces sp. TS71-3]
MTDTHHPNSHHRSVLVSGASVAGLAIACRLHRYGFRVTVVEKSDSVRGGGYPIDIRGAALEAIRRMELLPRLQKAHVDTRRITFLDADGGTIAALRPEAVAVGANEDIEVPRGDLTGALYEAVRDSVEFVFNDSIATLDDGSGGARVTFRGGARRTFDLVVGADGIHSHTRGLVLGPEERFHHYLGRCFAGFTVPNPLTLSHEVMLWSVPGRTAALYAVGSGELVHGLLTFAHPELPYDAFRSPERQCDMVAEAFPETAWELPRMVAAMHAADDLFFDVVSQIRMTEWTRGRVALVGDAAYAPSFLTGQGTSLALIGAYVLARELATYADHVEAFAAYEKAMRPFVTLNQGLVDDDGAVALFPSTEEAIQQRNTTLRSLATLPADRPPVPYNALRLPDDA